MAAQLPTRITEPTVLVVEGKDEEFFFSAIAKRLEIERLQIFAVGGKTNIRPNLKDLTRIPGFHSVTSLGVVRDANSDPKAAFESVCDALQNAELTPPEAVEQLAEGEPRVIILILPDGQNPGMLEDLCLLSVRNDPVLPCLDQFFDCIENTTAVPKELSKARVHAFLSSRDTPDLRLGEAARKGYWPFNNGAFDVIREFLAKLTSP